jgi:hypothetical protein
MKILDMTKYKYFRSGYWSKNPGPPASTLVSCWQIFDSEDEDDTFLRNVGSYTDYRALYPRRWQHSARISSEGRDIPFSTENK